MRTKTSIDKRLEEVVRYSRLSVRGFAMKCELKQQTFDKYVKGVVVPSFDTLVKIATTFPEISTDWLLLGKGKMLRDEQSNK